MPLVLWIVKGQFHTPDCFPTLAAGTLPECAVPDVVGKVVQLVVGMVQDVVEVVAEGFSCPIVDMYISVLRCLRLSAPICQSRYFHRIMYVRYRTTGRYQ